MLETEENSIPALNEFNKPELFERLLPTRKISESTCPLLTLNGYQLQVERILRNMTEWQGVKIYKLLINSKSAF